MSTRAMFVAATAMAAGFTPQAAFALTPLSIDSGAVEPESPNAPSPFAAAAPAAFSPDDMAAFEPTPQLNNRARLQCVPFVRDETHVDIHGNANTWWAQARGRYARARTPEAGAVMVMRGYASARRGHVAVVKAMVSDRVVLVDHANWLNHGEITRNVPVRDVSPNHDWTQVQVWHVTGAHWGGRTYRVQGFIMRDERREQAEASSAVEGPPAG